MTLHTCLPFHLVSRNARFGNDNRVGSHDITLEQSGAIHGREKRQIAVGRREVMPKVLLSHFEVCVNGLRLPAQESRYAAGE